MTAPSRRNTRHALSIATVYNANLWRLYTSNFLLIRFSSRWNPWSNLAASGEYWLADLHSSGRQDCKDPTKHSRDSCWLRGSWISSTHKTSLQLLGKWLGDLDWQAQRPRGRVGVEWYLADRTSHIQQWGALMQPPQTWFQTSLQGHHSVVWLQDTSMYITWYILQSILVSLFNDNHTNVRQMRP